ncbi:MAG: DUF6481 family protein [Pseudolabrys sp.]
MTPAKGAPSRSENLSQFRNPDAFERRNSAAAVKKAMLEKFRAATQDPDLEVKRQERLVLHQARLDRQAQRQAEREAERKTREAEEARLAAIEAERLAVAKREADELAALEASESAAAHEALLAEQKAKRDERYAARKAAKKARRRGY